MASTWEEWIDTLEMFFIASDIHDTKRMRALLLYLVGKDLQKIHRTLNDESDTYEKAKELLDSYFKPKANVTFEQTNFTTYIKWKTKLYQHLSLDLKMLPVHVILKIIHKNLQLLIVLFANVYQIDSDVDYYVNQNWT